MTRRARHVGAIVAIVLLAIAALAWWLDARTKPERVGPRLVDGLAQRHPGTTIKLLDRGALQAALPSGIYVDVQVPQLFDACRARRLRCTQTIDDALDAVDRAEASARTPTVDKLRPIVVGEPGGFRYGYVAEPLVGPYEVRYALVDGVASTFATGTIVDRLGLPGGALRDVALAGLRRDGPASLERIAAKDATLFRVQAAGDPVASLLDPVRMTTLATEVGARRLYAAIPLRGVLLLAAATDPSARALEALVARERGPDPKSLDGGILAYDVDAPTGQTLTIATLSPRLRQP